MTLPLTHRWIVRCEDGRIRHLHEGVGSFATLHEARTFAHYGHCCTNVHTYSEHAVLGAVDCIVLDGIDGPTLWDCECSSCRRIVADAEALDADALAGLL